VGFYKEHNSSLENKSHANSRQGRKRKKQVPITGMGKGEKNTILGGLLKAPLEGNRKLRDE